MTPFVIEAEKPWYTDSSKLIHVGAIVIAAILLVSVLVSPRTIDGSAQSTGPRNTLETTSTTLAPPQTARWPATTEPELITALSREGANQPTARFIPASLGSPDEAGASPPTNAQSTPAPPTWPASAIASLPAAALPDKPTEPARLAAIAPDKAELLPPVVSRSMAPGLASPPLARTAGEITCIAGCDSARRLNHARAAARPVRIADLGETARQDRPATASDSPPASPPAFNAIECIAGCGRKISPPAALPDQSLDESGKIIIRRGSAKAKFYSTN